MTRGICTALLAVLVSASCGQAALRPASGPAPKLPEAKQRSRRPPPPGWFWQPVDADVHRPGRRPLDLPTGDVIRTEGAARVWDELPADIRERVRRDGVLVLGSDTPLPPATAMSRRSMGAFYTDLRERRIPHVITIDALFALVHLGVQRTLSQIEEGEVVTGLQLVLDKLGTRLGAEAVAAGTELQAAYRTARGVVAVAQSLSATGPWTAPPDLAKVVAEERGHIEGHAGPASSPLLGVPIDYAALAVPSGAARPGSFRALAWLAAAPFSLVAKSEAEGAVVDVARARTNARAAMLLARLCDRDIDPALATTYTRLQRLLSFLWGSPDDLSITELDEVAEAIGIDVTKAANIANVARVDKVRARARAGRIPAAYDGSGGFGRGGVSVRIFGGHASADALALQSLVGSSVGLAAPSAAAAPIDRLRGGRRVLPSTLDIAAWLGAPEARKLLHETQADAFDGYDAALSALQQSPPTEQLHASVHGSLVDALVSWANAADGTTSGESWGVERTPAAARMRVESLLGAWTLIRHVGQVLSRPRPTAKLPPSELRVSGATLPVFVEPLPDVIARLVATVRQLRHGLEALVPLVAADATSSLVEIEDMLQAALKSAERHASDDPLTAEEASALASLPARMARLEGESADVGPVIAVAYSDPASRRVLATATGAIEPVLMFAREPGKDEPLLVMGAHVAHHELALGVEHAPGVLHGVRPALTDASWRARVETPSTSPEQRVGAPAAPIVTAATAKPVRAPWVSSFRWTR